MLDKLAYEFIETFDGIYTKYHCSGCAHFCTIERLGITEVIRK